MLILLHYLGSIHANLTNSVFIQHHNVGRILSSKINVKLPMTLAAVHSMVVLLLFFHYLFVAPIGCGGFVLSVFILIYFLV